MKVSGIQWLEVCKILFRFMYIRNMFRMMYMFYSWYQSMGCTSALISDSFYVHKNLQYMISFFQNFESLGFGFFIVLEAINHIYI